ncbi:RNA-directed DNA polymerase, partial [Klebsiella pneumoniae]|nr:RNA-directed DNA polymerase [Klebsiella pneumoniae]
DFQIPKRRGGVRTISAPIEKLKLLQKRVATLLEECIDEIDAERGVRNTLSHGFRKKHSILTNAAPHRNRRYV